MADFERRLAVPFLPPPPATLDDSISWGRYLTEALARAFDEVATRIETLTGAGATESLPPSTGERSLFYDTTTEELFFDGPSGWSSLGRISGPLSIGDGTNDVVISSGGIILLGTSTMWDDLRVNALSTKVPSIGGPGFAKLKDDGNMTPSTGVFTYMFDASSEESIYFAVQMPHRWKLGSDIFPHVHWCPVTSGILPADVCWGLEYTWGNINANFSNTTIIYGDEQSNGSSEVMSAYKHYITPLGTISGTGKTLSSMLVCRLFRDATGAGGTDDYPNDAALLEIDFHYEVDSLGSQTEYSKSTDRAK